MVVLVIAVTAFAPAALLVPLFMWARWLRRRTTAPRYAAVTALGIVAVSALVTVMGAVAAIHAVTAARIDESSDASVKARVLAEGISEAMNCGALGVAIAVPAAVWLLFATWRWHWRR